MPRFQLDDSIHSDPAVVRAGTAAFGLYCRCGVYCAEHLLDGLVPVEIAAQYGTPEWTRKLLDVGLWTTQPDGYQDTRWTANGNPLKRDVLADRAKRAELKNPMILKAVRDRDGDRCRYCAHRVNWTDRRGTYGATYDHVIPGLLAGAANLVVACRSCNSAKKDRTPEEAGMTLLDPPPNRTPRSDLGTTQNGTRSDLTPKSFPSGKTTAGGRANGKPAASQPPLVAVLGDGHPFTADADGNCAHCSLPESNRHHQPPQKRARRA